MQEFVMPKALTAVYAGRREEGKTTVKKRFSADRQTDTANSGRRVFQSRGAKRRNHKWREHRFQTKGIHLESGDSSSEFIED